MKQVITTIAFIFFSLPVVFTQTVYKTPSGARYHKAHCRMVQNVSQKISLDQVRDYGLTPCKICGPALIPLAATPKKVSGQQVYAQQCKGRTRQNIRCKRSTRIANGFCFQHQPGG